MNFHQQIKHLVQQDPNAATVAMFAPAPNLRDRNHFERRKQQRAISDAMIQLALVYGVRKRFSRGAVAYVLTANRLLKTPYKRFISELRGLTVLCTEEPPSAQLATAYWQD
jgi:hypothetical protein